jgi:ABC-2 type transport system ATP-binding protein
MISCNQLTKRFGARTAVDRVNFEVQHGEICVLLGPNGAGKSTLVNMLCGLVPPSEGQAIVAGFSIIDPGAAFRKRIGVVPETLGLLSELTIEENLAMTGSIYGLDSGTTRIRSEQLLRVLGIYDTRHTFAKDCSHGMRKKTSLAMALLHNPTVLFLDEPFEGLDPVSAESIHYQLRHMSRRGITIFLTSHILAFVERIADRLMLIRGGRLVWNSTLAELHTDLQSLYFELAEAPVTEELEWLQSQSS